MWLAILHGILQQIAENLLKREAIRYDGWHLRLNLNLTVRFGYLMLNICCGILQKRIYAKGFRRQHPTAFAGELQDGIDKSNNLAD